MAVCSTLFPCRFALLQFHDFNNTTTKLQLQTMSLLPSKSPFHLASNAKFNSTNHHVFHNHNHNRTLFKFRASTSSSGNGSNSGTKVILFNSAITITLAVANRVLYKLALVPMNDYPFFLAQFTTVGYVVIYFSILYIRYRAGIVTNEMLSIPKWRFLIIGFLEALGVASGMSAGAVLPGPVIPILNQTFLVWQLMFSTLLLGRRYSINQLAGCLLVAAGVVVSVARSYWNHFLLGIKNLFSSN